MAAAQIAPLPVLTPAEELHLEDRRRAVDSALGTTLAEGEMPPPEVLHLMEQYAAGELTLDEIGAAVRALYC